MPRTILSILSILSVLFLATAAIAADEKPAAEEQAKLKGKWQVISIEADGKPLKEQDKMPTFDFTGDKMTGFGPEMTFTIDPTKKPKQITLKAKVGERDITINSIYAIEGDELKFMIPLVEKGKGPENKRPESFETKGKPVMLFTAKRQK
jgi:uncharacterized protein (TIGR03067 family)